MSASLKLICLNIEKDRHLDLIVPFLSAQMPDVLCAQELYESSIPSIVSALEGASCFFVPMTRRGRESPVQLQGIGIFSRVPTSKQQALYYKGSSEHLPESVQGDPSTYANDNRMVAMCDVKKDGTIFRIGTTHFTWTPDGNPSVAQKADVKSLLAVLDTIGDFVLAGDFNAPRGGQVFSILAGKYKDNIPSHYETSLDLDLHIAGKLRGEELKTKMVDGIFSTSSYVVSDVEMVFGVSDHCALIAEISRKISRKD